MELEKNKSFKWEYKEPEIDHLRDEWGYYTETVEVLPRRKVTVFIKGYFGPESRIYKFDKLTTSIQDGYLTIYGTTDKITTKIVFLNWENFIEENDPNETYEYKLRKYSRWHNQPLYAPKFGGQSI